MSKKTSFRLIAFLIIVIMLVNTLLQTFGDTLTTYLGLSGSAGEAAMSDAECMEEGREITAEIESEGAVLLRNENNTLPLEKGSKVTILGAMSYNYICGGTGELVTFAGSDYSTNKDAYGNGDWGGYSQICEFDQSVYTDNKDSFMEEGYNDVAIVTFARSGAEGASPVMDYDGDGVASTGTTYLQLSEDELGLLQFCNENYEKTIVLINSSTPIELGEIEQEEYGVDACLWIGHPGEAGLVGVAQVLTGEVNPSGHLVDTYAYDMSTMPSFYNNDDNKYTNVESITTGFGQSSNFGYYQYEEGIYIGYRFYETADAEGYFDSAEFTSHEWKNGTASGYEEVVQYPFGYGLSYTTFEQEVTASDVALEAHGTNSITVKVTNTGDYAGKEVVQLYMEAPYGTDETCGISGVGLEKSSKVLMGFQKTGVIEPGESEEVTIEFSTDDLASFDTYGHGCYVLEKGDYIFHIGENAHTDAAEPVTALLADSYYYNEEGVGARDSDETVAEVSMSDVDAGDGNMLDGYLSRNAFAYGMDVIMQHESSCKEEALSDELVEVLATPALESTEYTYETYENGVKVSKTDVKYVGGADYQAYATEENIEGKDQNDESYLYDDAVTDHEIWAYLLDQTTLEEQIYVQGNQGWSTPEIESVNKLRDSVVDGPGESGNGNSSYGINTWFTSAVVNASTWNPYLIEKMGEVYAHQSIKNGLAGAYCPAMNTHRTPFGGRNFEYYSEDGFIGGKIGAAQITGLQSNGIYVYIKHMAMNDNDTNRDGNLTWFSEQAAREIMLKDYEICVKETYVVDDEETQTGHYESGEGTLGIMASLNRDGISMFHPGLYRTILRDEWGYNGLVITDGVGPYPWVMSPGAGLFGIIAER